MIGTVAVARGGLPCDDRSRLGQRAGGGGRALRPIAGSSKWRSAAFPRIRSGAPICRNSWATTAIRRPDSAMAPTGRLSRLATTRRCAKRPARRCAVSSRSRMPIPSKSCGKNRALEVAYRTAAEASYRLGDYAAADAEIKKALAIRRAIPTRTLAEERDADDQLMLAALIAARLQRYAEAQQIIEPVLKLHRGLYERKDNDDLSQRVQFAHALYVSALAAPGQKAAQLTQAATHHRRPAAADAPPAQRRVPARSDRRGTEGAALAVRSAALKALHGEPGSRPSLDAVRRCRRSSVRAHTQAPRTGSSVGRLRSFPRRDREAPGRRDAALLGRAGARAIRRLEARACLAGSGGGGRRRTRRIWPTS